MSIYKVPTKNGQGDLNSSYSDYKTNLYKRFWEYQKSRFPESTPWFDRPYASILRPPVFLRDQAQWNVITSPAANGFEKQSLLELIPKGERHKWFRSMSSSQALAQSVLGNLKVYNALAVLSEVEDENEKGLKAFGELPFSSDQFDLEHKVTYLGETRQTSLDGFIEGDYQVAIECKLTEAEFGSCSRPRLTPKDTNYGSEHCDATNPLLASGANRCPLIAKGIKYWSFGSALFDWKGSEADPFCPLNQNYQLVRNVLSACVKDERVSPRTGHAVVIYDNRNPAFRPDGKAGKSFNETRSALLNKHSLRKCSWQSIVKQMRDNRILPWLIEDLAQKYGL